MMPEFCVRDTVCGDTRCHAHSILWHHIAHRVTHTEESSVCDDRCYIVLCGYDDAMQSSVCDTVYDGVLCDGDLCA